MRNVNRWSPIPDIHIQMGAVKCCWLSHPGSSNHWLAPLYNGRLTTGCYTKAHRCQDKQSILTFHSCLGSHLCKPYFWVLSLMLRTYFSYEFQMKIGFVSYFWEYTMHSEYWNRPLMKWNRHLMKSLSCGVICAISTFWKTISPFMINKYPRNENNIILWENRETDVDSNETIKLSSTATRYVKF